MPENADFIRWRKDTATLVDGISLVSEKDLEKLEVLQLEECKVLKDSWFLDGENGQVDAIMGFCAGIQFIYPPMVSAIANGMCSPAMKLVTSGFDTDASIISAIGDSEDRIIASVTVSPAEDGAYALILLDNAITGNQYDDFVVERIDSFEYIMDSNEDIDAVMAGSLMGTPDASLAQIPVEMVVNELCKRNNPDATYEQLKATFHDGTLLGPDALAE